MRQHVMGGVCLAIGLLTASPSAAATDAVLRWNENAGKAATAACLTPEGNALAESRMYAMVHIAVHDALNAIDRRSHPYAYDVQVKGGTSSSAAIAAAARDVLVAVIGQLQESGECIQRGLATVEADYAAALGELPDNQPKARGIAVGQAAARAILTLRANDGSDTLLVAHAQGCRPASLRGPFAFAPLGRGDAGLLSTLAVPRRPPFPVGKRIRGGLQVKSLGADGSTERTAEQTEIGLFWIELAARVEPDRETSVRQYDLHANAAARPLLAS